jgi:hypothetical protein
MASNKSKHIDIKDYYIRELVDARTIGVVSLGTSYMLAPSHQDNTLLASLRDKATHITDSHTYKHAYYDFTLRRTHASLLPRLKPLWQYSIAS